MPLPVKLWTSCGKCASHCNNNNHNSNKTAIILPKLRGNMACKVNLVGHLPFPTHNECVFLLLFFTSTVIFINVIIQKIR